MVEKRNRRLLISLVVLTIITGAVYLIQPGDTGVSVDPTLFRPEHLSEVDHIVLESRNAKVDLQYDGSRWKVNERFEADRRLIDVLFAALEQARPKRPVALSQRDSVNGDFRSKGVTVRLFEGLDLKKQFLVGGASQKNETYFRLDSTSEAYLMMIPGYRVYLGGIFEIDENGWRDKRIFSFRLTNFKSLTQRFPADPAADFEINKKDKVFGVEGLEKSDTARVNTYLDDVSLLVADQIVTPGVSKRLDSLAKTPPVTTLEIKDIANRSYQLNLFRPLAGETLILGTSREHGLVLFDRRKVFRVTKRRGYFQGAGSQ
jgi:hypothetical protein